MTPDILLAPLADRPVPKNKRPRYRLRIFQDAKDFTRRHLYYVGEKCTDLPAMLKAARQMVEDYCKTHPGHHVYQSGDLEYVAEPDGRKDRRVGVQIEFGVQIVAV
jgi:hypothetical protein